MPAHRALSVPDVVHLIFDQIGVDKPTLARSARCCKGFHETSLNILWKNLGSFAPLRDLLPNLETEENETSVSTNSINSSTQSYKNVRLPCLKKNGEGSHHIHNVFGHGHRTGKGATLVFSVNLRENAQESTSFLIYAS